MNPTEIAVHVVKAEREEMVFNLFAKRVGQAGESPHLHTHCWVLALHIGGWQPLKLPTRVGRIPVEPFNLPSSGVTFSRSHVRRHCKWISQRKNRRQHSTGICSWS